MIKYMAAALVGALLVPAAQAQTASDGTQTTSDTMPASSDTSSPETPRAPDGTRAFGIEPYVGVMGGYEDFDSDQDGPLTTNCNGRSGCPDGAVIDAVAGVNVPLGPLFVGAEGSISKGFSGIKWEYAAYGRLGFRAGASGLLYGKAGREWIHTDDKGNNDNISYGLGVEVGPKDIGLKGITNNAGFRLRFEVTSYDLKSIRPSSGVVFHF